MLPVSGVRLAVREPTGDDELFVLEASSPATGVMLVLVERVVTTEGGDPVAWGGLPACDLDAVALAIRRRWLGELVSTDARCPSPECCERIDVSFTVSDYLAHHRPRTPRNVVADADAGWYNLAGAPVRFRIPTIADLVDAQAGPEPGDALAGRCIDPPGVPASVARRVSRALSALAPRLDDHIGGRCPMCGHEVAMRFDPIGYTLAELRHAFAGLHWETHTIASAYGWPEAAILALPRSRRRRYATIISEERSVA